MMSACILVRTEGGKFEEVVETIKNLKEAKEVFSVLGRYDVAVNLETEDFSNLCRTAMRIGRIAGVVFTETLIEVPTREEDHI